MTAGRERLTALAVAAGADHLVVGRPVTRAADPQAAARAIIAEMGSGVEIAAQSSPPPVFRRVR